MKLTLDNYKQYVDDKYCPLMKSLILDIEETNKLLDHKVYIDLITEHTEHTEYSPERTDPCPDYYGYYYIRFEDHPEETLGIEMDIHQLDMSLCVLENYINFINKYDRTSKIQ